MVLMKRLFDTWLALCLIFPISVITLLIWLIIKLESSGPGIFCQKRVGRNGTPFVCYKLRTMYVGTEEVPTHHVSKNTVTPFGAVLRRLKLDEMPQIWNVIVGDMSFVGPRPCLPSQLELIEARRLLGVLTLRPGITGIAQVQGIDMSDAHHLANEDAKYLRENGLWVDVKLILATFSTRARGDRSR